MKTLCNLYAKDCNLMGSTQDGIVFPFPLTIARFLRQEKNKLLTTAATAIKHQIGK